MARIWIVLGRPGFLSHMGGRNVQLKGGEETQGGGNTRKTVLPGSWFELIRLTLNLLLFSLMGAMGMHEPDSQKWQKPHVGGC